MDAQLVWDTWRRILKSDQLVDWINQPKNSDVGVITGLTDEEISILVDYADTPTATNTNIGMYRCGLVRNALAALGLVPLTRRFLYMSGFDVEAVATDFVKSTGYRDDGPNFWKIAGSFVAYIARMPEFGTLLRQEALAIDAALVALARRLGESAPEVWPESCAMDYCGTNARERAKSACFVVNSAALLTSSSFNLTPWLEDPEDFDVDEALEPSTRHWLIYFPAADAAPTYAELSDRTARVFNFLSIPRTMSEVSITLDGLSGSEVQKVINSLMEIGVVVEREMPDLDCENSAVGVWSKESGTRTALHVPSNNSSRFMLLK